MRVERLLDRPIITADLHPSIGENIQGPSLIRVPDWIEGALAAYYLYFADHKGRYIRLAYADELTGPWAIHPPGSLQIEDSHFLTEPPAVTEEILAEFDARRTGNAVKMSHDVLTEVTTPHIASPDVHVDAERRRIVMYFHGLEAPGQQVTRVATSEDGILFEALPEVLGRTYLRVFAHDGVTYGLAMPGRLYRSADGLHGFEEGPCCSTRTCVTTWPGSTATRCGCSGRRSGTRRSESCSARLISPATGWSGARRSRSRCSVRSDWEGASAPLEPSIRSSAYGVVNQLRDPAVFEEHGRLFLLYAVGGEAGIAIAEVMALDG